MYKDFYVSPNGCDSADGSKSSPFLTLERATRLLSEISGDIRINFAPGEYEIKETVNITPENSTDRKIVFKGDKAVFFGGVRVKGWEKYTDKIYKAPLDVIEARNLYVNTFPATRARTNYKYLISSLEMKGDVAVGMRVSEKNFPKSFHNWHDIEVVNPYEWETHRYKITDYTYSPETHEYVFEFDVSYNKIKRLGKDTYCFYLENDLTFVKNPGDFYYDRAEKTIYYYPYDQEDLTTADTYVGCKEMFVHILGRDGNRAGNVSFEGIRFAGGACNAITPRGYRCYQSDAIDNSVPELSAADPVDGYFSINTSQFRMNYAENVEFKNCEFVNMGSSVIAMNDSVSNVLIEGNIFRDSSAGAIRVGNGYHKNQKEGVDVCSDITIKNNVITRMSGELHNNCAISVYYEKNVKILNNLITDMPYTGVTLGWGWEGAVGYDCRNIEAAYNRIERVMCILHDGGSVYTLGEIKNCSIHDNYFEDTGDRGLYNDAGSARINSYNNVVLGCKWFLQIQELKYLTNNIKVYNNFSDSHKILGPQKSDTIDVEPPIMVDRANLPDEAKAIIKAAGLADEYKHLEEAAKLPEWHKVRTHAKAGATFKSKSDKLIHEMRGEIEAEDFMEGGEGVAFHKTFQPSKNNNSYRPEEVQLTYSTQMMSHAIHMDEAGEWLCYKWNCPVTDDYTIEMTVAHAKGEETIARWYVDDKLLTDKIPAEYQPIYYPVKSEPCHIEKGEHILKMEFVNPFYFDKFRLFTGKELPIPEELFYTTDEDFDE